jgi:hypothetical protein
VSKCGSKCAAQSRAADTRTSVRSYLSWTVPLPLPVSQANLDVRVSMPAKDEQMKIGPRTALIAGLYLALASGVFAQTSQSPDPSKWTCRNLSDSGGFVNQGETIIGSQACVPRPQTLAQAPPATASATVASPQVQQAAAKPSPIGSAVASGKPQVTMFEHQTLGESWEDFMRISGSKMSPCTSSDPQIAGWCDTFKAIESSGQGTLTQSNPSASVSLVFAERRLAQVVFVAKAAWGASLADLEKTYGTPDTQTTDSAIWSFSDGGGVSLSEQSGGLIRGVFYSKDGKSAQEIPALASLPEVFPSGSSPEAPAQASYLTPTELRAATQGGGKGVTITAGSTLGQTFAASLANVNLAQYASIQLFTTESWIAFRAHLAHQQYQQFDPTNLSPKEMLRGLIVVALGGAYGTNAGPSCNSVTRIALISDKGGAQVAEAVTQDSASSSWSNAFGASASCNALVAKFAATDVQRVTAAAQQGEYFVGVFSGTNMLFMYKVKEKYLKDLGR